MKLSNLLIVFASCVNGAIVSMKNGSIPLINMKSLNVRFAVTTTFDDNLDPNLITSSSSPNAEATEEELACIKEEQNYTECLTIEYVSNDTCKFINEGKCSEFFNDPISVMPSCGKIDQNQKDALIHLIKSSGNSFKLFCVNNTECPIAKDMISFTTSKTNSLNDQLKGYVPKPDVISENCKIPECTSKSIDLFTELVAFNEAIVKKIKEKPEKMNQKIENALKSVEEQTDGLNNAINTLKQCNGSSTSNVTKNVVGNMIIDSITLLAIFLFYNY